MSQVALNAPKDTVGTADKFFKKWPFSAREERNMSIDIKSLTQSQTRGAGDSRGASDVSRPGSNSSASKTTAPEGDKVTLTETARRLTNLEQNAKAQPTVDQEKVAAIRQAIQEGRYQVNADSVAGNIMKNEALYPL